MTPTAGGPDASASGVTPHLLSLPMELAAAIIINCLVWIGAFAIARRFSSPTVYFYGLAAVSTITAGIVANAFSLPDWNYLVVVALPLVATAVVTVRSALRQKDQAS